MVRPVQESVGEEFVQPARTASDDVLNITILNGRISVGRDEEEVGKACLAPRWIQWCEIAKNPSPRCTKSPWSRKPPDFSFIF